MQTLALEKIRNPVTHDLKAADQLILKELVSDISLIQQITQHIISSGGKRLRPLIVILCARACGYQDAKQHLELAVIIEFVHTATLLHDDVVDKSNLRRGQDTANAIWGNQASVLVGDFLYSRAFQILTRNSNVDVMQALSDTTNAIAEGEVLQLMNRHDPQLSEQSYLDVIERKTARLFQSAAEIGAMIATEDRQLRDAAAQYGLNVGMAFQIVDDLLDYTSDDDTLGKHVGDDFADSKATLPLIHAINNTDDATAKKIHSALIEGKIEHMDIVLDAIKNTGAVQYCIDKANHYIDKALAALTIFPESEYKASLLELTNFTKERSY
ncbi:MAG: polyprenyl synthetase family protein [Gammaproteobacteria bacterium]|nr:polyprenyl synthetase family protein [Gammaproteobacteria bacterium]MCH9743589.1 polyprenyl synthetase family protein [Gammaproteobacteria bacterium]